MLKLLTKLSDVRIVVSRLPSRQLQQVTAILLEIGTVALASVVIPAFYGKIRAINILSGTVITTLSWASSILILKKK